MSKKTIIILLVILAIVAIALLNRGPATAPTDLEVAEVELGADNTQEIQQDLDALDLQDLDKEFQDIDKELENL